MFCATLTYYWADPDTCEHSSWTISLIIVLYLIVKHTYKDDETSKYRNNLEVWTWLWEINGFEFWSILRWNSSHVLKWSKLNSGRKAHKSKLRENVDYCWVLMPYNVVQCLHSHTLIFHIIHKLSVSSWDFYKRI